MLFKDIDNYLKESDNEGKWGYISDCIYWFKSLTIVKIVKHFYDLGREETFKKVYDWLEKNSYQYNTEECENDRNALLNDLKEHMYKS